MRYLVRWDGSEELGSAVMSFLEHSQHLPDLSQLQAHAAASRGRQPLGDARGSGTFCCCSTTSTRISAWIHSIRKRLRGGSGISWLLKCSAWVRLIGWQSQRCGLGSRVPTAAADQCRVLLALNDHHLSIKKT
jgi:hypothetical protein